MKAPRVKMDGPPAPVLAPPGETAVKPKVLEKFIADPKGGAVQVGALDVKMMKALGTKSPKVLLSADTMKKQLGRAPGQKGHPELGLKDYVALAMLIGQPELAFINNRQRLVVVRDGAGILIAVLKTANDGAETYVVSVRRSNLKDLAALLRGATIIAGDPNDWARR